MELGELSPDSISEQVGAAPSHHWGQGTRLKSVWAEVEDGQELFDSKGRKETGQRQAWADSKVSYWELNCLW